MRANFICSLNSNKIPTHFEREGSINAFFKAWKPRKDQVSGNLKGKPYYGMRQKVAAAKHLPFLKLSIKVIKCSKYNNCKGGLS